MKNVLCKPSISFVILTWNSEKYLKNCFTSILKKCNKEDLSFEVIVVDNGSCDGSVQVVEQFQKYFDNQFFVITLQKNCGTTYPRNIGLKRARGEFICILDSDTELEEGSLNEVINYLKSNLKFGLIVPRLLLPDGTVQNSVKRFPTMLNKLMKIPRIVFGIDTRNTDFYENFPFQEEREVDTAISACWFFRKGLLEKVGYLDEKIFYAPEDIDYSLRVWLAGNSILYFPSFTVLHHTQQITHKKPFSRTSLSHFRGLLYFYWKHGGWVKKKNF